jgi:hypothetical protein
MSVDTPLPERVGVVRSNNDGFCIVVIEQQLDALEDVSTVFTVSVPHLVVSQFPSL